MNSLSCDRARALLSDLLLGAVDAAEEEALDAHLVGCAACRLQMEQFVWQDRVLAELSAQDRQAELAERIRRALSLGSPTGDPAVEEAPISRIAVRSVPIRPGARKWWAALAAGLAAAVLAIAYRAQVGDQDRLRPVVAHLGQVKGEVHLLAENGKVPAQAGQAIHAGEGIETEGLGSFAVVKYADDTRLRLGADTTMREFGGQPSSIGSSEPGQQAFLARGLVRADVVGRPGKESFRLRTPAARVNVRSTRFTVASEADVTRVDVEKGLAELIRESDGKVVQVGEGHYARAAFGKDMISKEPEWQELFNGDDLTGWRPFHGQWRVEDGTMIGSSKQSKGARIDTRRRHEDFELTCQVWHTGYAEIQVRSYGWFFPLRSESADWHNVRITARGRTFECVVDGRSVSSRVDGGPGPGRGDNPAGPLTGVIGLYVKADGTLRVKDVRLRQF